MPCASLQNLDNVFIGYADDRAVVTLVDNFSPLNEDNFLFLPNFEVQDACGREDVLLGSGARASFTTRDLNLIVDPVPVFVPTLGSSVDSTYWADVKGFQYTRTCGMSSTGWFFSGNLARLVCVCVCVCVCKPSSLFPSRFLPLFFFLCSTRLHCLTNTPTLTPLSLNHTTTTTIARPRQSTWISQTLAF